MEKELLDLAHEFSTHAQALAPFIQRYGYAGLFVAVLVEGFGIPAPGQTLLTVGALLAARNELDIVTLVVVAWSATVIGNLIGYLLGRRAGRRLLLRIGVRRSRIRRVEKFVRRYGPVILVVARFVDGLRQFSSIVAGSMKMPWWTFLASIVVGASLWAGVIGAGAYYLQRDVHAVAAVFARVGPYGWAIGAAAVLVLFLCLIRRRRGAEALSQKVTQR